MLKKAVSFLGWALVALTMLSLILTVLTTYQLISIQYVDFTNYRVLDILIVLTMIVWAVNFYDNSEKSRNVLFSLGCALIALGTLFFMYIGVV